MTTGAAPSTIVLTFDIDWAPDWMIHDLADMLAKAGVRGTFFATHDSPAIRQLQGEVGFEVGVHPNFLPGSSHGGTPDAVMQTVLDWFPEARAARTHSLAQSEPLLGLMARSGIAVDCSIHLPQADHVAPHALRLEPGGPQLIRIPHVFQDNMYMMAGQPWEDAADWLLTPGLKVLNFHPVHVALNAGDVSAYGALRRKGPLMELKRRDMPPTDRDAPGARRFLAGILARMRSQPSFTVSETAALWVRGKA